ncbi:hypothetical protein HCU40_19645 (plasmid) [Pseudanabaena biceps]|nr:hypothetical protein [Pseudanabaena biceps]
MKFRSFGFRVLVVIVFALIAFAIPAIAQRASSSGNVKSWIWTEVDLAPVVASLRVSLEPTGVPLRLPTKTFVSGAKPLQVYLDSDKPSANGYDISIGYRKGCDFANSCRIGSVEARRLSDRSPSLDKAHPPEPDVNGVIRHRSDEEAGSVSLAGGIQGYFVPWVCGASCNDAQVYWDENGFRYAVGIKVGNKNNLIQMANSAISQI